MQIGYFLCCLNNEYKIEWIACTCMYVHGYASAGGQECHNEKIIGKS